MRFVEYDGQINFDERFCCKLNQDVDQPNIDQRVQQHVSIVCRLLASNFLHIYGAYGSQS